MRLSEVNGSPAPAAAELARSASKRITELSASLTYVSAPQPESTRSAVREFIRLDTAGYKWWAESLSFFEDPKRSDQLVGNTKLFRLIDDPAADSFMASTDMDHILGYLEAASEKFGVDWQLFLQDTPVGMIAGGRRDEKAGNAVKGLLKICDAMGIDPAELDRGRIFAQYCKR